MSFGPFCHFVGAHFAVLACQHPTRLRLRPASAVIHLENCSKAHLKVDIAVCIFGSSTIQHRYEFKRKLILFTVSQGSCNSLRPVACPSDATMPQLFASTLTYYRVIFTYDWLVIYTSFPSSVQFSVSASA